MNRRRFFRSLVVAPLAMAAFVREPDMLSRRYDITTMQGIDCYIRSKRHEWTVYAKKWRFLDSFYATFPRTGFHARDGLHSDDIVGETIRYVPTGETVRIADATSSTITVARY